jgi:hypothetical protein
MPGLFLCRVRNERSKHPELPLLQATIGNILQQKPGTRSVRLLSVIICFIYAPGKSFDAIV